MHTGGDRRGPGVGSEMPQDPFVHDDNTANNHDHDHVADDNDESHDNHGATDHNDAARQPASIPELPPPVRSTVILRRERHR